MDAKNDGGLTLARGAHEMAFSRTIGMKRTNSFLLRFVDGRLLLRMNGSQWLAEQPLPEGVTLDASSVLGLGAVGGGEQTIRFEDLQWRSVTSPSPSE